jgi:hypothetical protein
MTTFTWHENQHTTFYPWDTRDTVLFRIGEKENIPISYLSISQDIEKLMEEHPWEEEVEIYLEVKDKRKEWDQTDMITTFKQLPLEERKLYVRYKTLQKEIDQSLWETLFQHEFQDISFEEWRQEVKQMETLEKEKKKRTRQLSQWFEELSMEEEKPIVGWKSEKHQILYQIHDPRTMEELFANVRMDNVWRLVLFHQKFFQWGEKNKWIAKMKRLKDPTLEVLCREIQTSSMETGIYLFHQELDTPLSIQLVSSQQNKNLYEIGVETSTEFPNLIEKVQETLEMSSSITKQTDVGMVGHFIIPQFYIDFPLFQDMCMNDPVVSYVLYINELHKPTFDVVMGVCLQQSMKDLLQMETIKNYDISIKNTHRQSGFQVMVSLHTPISEKKLGIFFLLIRLLMGRYLRKRDGIVDDYLKFIPNIKTILEKTQKSLIKNIKSTRPEYISKYPRMFVRNLYSVICQKPLQPTLVKEDEIYDLPKDSYLLFPPQPIAEINPEYYYCPSKEYPFAGLKEVDLKGKDTFINLAPCCFNSPQDKENEKKIGKLRTKDDMEEEEKEKTTTKTNIILGKFLIKHAGQLGTIRPPSMNRFFMAYDPFADYFRVGTEQSPSSLVYCMLTRRNKMGLTTPYHVAEVRLKIAEDPNCVDACLQENPGLTPEQVRSDIANPQVYFDPRRFYRAVELFFGVRMIVFTKSPNMTEEDAQLLLPFSMRTHYTNHSDLPFTIIFEHWGGKTNILSKFQYPHCELIGFKPFTESSMRFDFSPKGIFQLLENVVYPFDGNQAIQPFSRKKCWFFRHLIGQTPDPLGKIRWLHFQYYHQTFYAEIEPPLAIQDDIPIGDLPETLPIVKAQSMLRFLNKFDHWEKIHVPDPDGEIVYWTVSQQHVFWKSQEENSKLNLTFVCRLEQPQPLSLKERDNVLQKYIRTSIPTNTMLYKPSDSTTISHDEKIANLLSQLCISAFSFFLKKNKVKQDSVEMDMLLETFFQQHVVISTRHVYPKTLTNQYHELLTENGKIILPSLQFWKKVMFHLKWLLFYQPQYLFDPEKTLPKRLQEIGDFAQEDPPHYYCDLDQLQNVLDYSIEHLYDVVSCPISELPSLCKKQPYVIWYEKTISPYPHPSLIVLYPSYPMTVSAIRIWRQDHRIVSSSSLFLLEEEEEETDIYDWEPTLQLWKPTEKMGASPMYRARVGESEYLLFFPME